MKRSGRLLLAWLVMLVVGITVSLRAHALSVHAPRHVQSADLSDGQAEMYTHERKSGSSGSSCSERNLGKVRNLHTVQLGDTITLGDKSFRVGVIHAYVGRVKQDFWSGSVTYMDLVCLLAANPDKMPPFKDDCDALWVLAEPCKLLEYQW